MDFKERTLIAGFEILLLVSMIFSFSVIFRSYVEYGPEIVVTNESKFIEKSREIILNYLGKNMVSAQEGLWTCPVNNNGSYCQEYIASQCDENCQEDCLPSRADQTSICRTGTCIYNNGLSCSPNTPQLRCEDSELGIGGTWDARQPGEIAQCQRGCCLVGSNAQFVTEGQCNAIANSIGLSLDGVENKFDAGISSELQCLILANPLSEGACVYSEEVQPGLYDCDVITKQSCLNAGGEFFEGYLCSNTDLDTVCERQASTSCVQGKDEVYWLDSCGNRENIYEGGSGTARDRSWNNGRLLSKEESCVLSDGDDPVKNQKTCGNCNYLGGSVCGLPGANDESPSEGDYVCKDLSCTFVDEFGQRQTRLHGESWCSYDGKIGTEETGNAQRGVDVPGSSHYRNVCLDGEVRVEQCLSGRREICAEERDEEVGFSSAACRLNQWALCYEMNQNQEDLNRCEEITDCVIKNVDLTSRSNDNFKFSLCVPKYPPGFELRPDIDQISYIRGAQSDGEIACALASVQCKKVTIKKLFGKKTINDRCDDAEFTETMNNLCMSLGDCGGSVNLKGTYTDEGYSVVNAPELAQNYISGLRRLINAERGQMGEPLSQAEINSLYGIDTGADNYEPDSSNLQMIGMLSGAAGSVLAYGAKAGWLGATRLAVTGGFLTVDGIVPVGASAGKLVPYSQLGAYASAAAGAMIGASIVSLLLGFTGVGAGLGEELQYALIIGGAIAGAIIGWQILGPGFAAGSWFPIVGWALAIFVIAIIVIGWLMGWGKKKVKTITFDCKPWQAPLGGASCGECGADGLPCNEYKCQSLGQTCELINKGTNEESCINVSPNDTSAPIISPNDELLQEGFEYVGESSLGFNVKGPTSDGCLPVYTPVTFGLELNEPGQCKFELTPGNSYSAMQSYFGGSNLYRINHQMTVNMPNLAALQDEELNPDVRADFNLYVRCSDRSGNANNVDYAVSFCVSPEDDLTAPILSRFNPQTGSYVSYNSEEKRVNFYVNEPADCRWSQQDVDFEVMTDEAPCVQDVESMTPYGFACEVDLPVNANENMYYFRCKDQPWLEDSNPDGLIRNVNTQSVIYRLIKSQSQLQIDSIRPQNETISAGNVEFVKVNLVVQTSGGAQGTARVCKFDFANNGRYVQFYETGGDTHKQELNLLFNDYNIGIRCEDEAGNIAEGSTQFSVEMDSTGPIITRFYNLNNKLHVITNERSECVYSHDSCGFNFNNGTSMAGYDLIHTTPFNSDLRYYVKCKDSYENPSSCVAISGGRF